MFKNFVYALEGPSPPERNELGWWGFSAHLDKNFAIKLREVPMDQRNYDRLNKEARDIIIQYGLDEMGEIDHPYGFIEGSWLLAGIQVPGNSCDLSLSCHDREAFLEGKFLQEKEMVQILNDKRKSPIGLDYTPHNVDKMEQAFCLSSLFTNFMNPANMCFNG